MPNSPIYWLRFTKTVKTKIDGHYILKAKEKFMVFLSQPINGVICTKISDKNIKDQEKPQYIAEKTHHFDPDLHKLTQPNECNVYYAKYSKDLIPLEQKLSCIDKITEQ